MNDVWRTHLGGVAPKAKVVLQLLVLAEARVGKETAVVVLDLLVVPRHAARLRVVLVALRQRRERLREPGRCVFAWNRHAWWVEGGLQLG